jgi:hypothetical protein
MQFGFRTRDTQPSQNPLTQGLDSGFTKAIEMVVTPLLFALFGYWLDGVFGIRPILTATLGGLAFFGCVASIYYRYMADVAREEEGKPWTKSPR